MNIRRWLYVAVILAVWVLLACVGPTQAKPLDWSGGVFWNGRSAEFTVEGSARLVEEPVVDFDLLYSVADNELAAGLSTHVRTVADPLGRLIGVEWAPWAELIMDRVSVGGALARTDKGFPVSGAVYLKVNALQLTW